MLAEASLVARASDEPVERFLAMSVVALAAARTHDPATPALIADALAMPTFEPTPESALQLAHLMVLTGAPERVRAIVQPAVATDVSARDRARLLAVLGLADAWAGSLVTGELALREARELAADSGQPALLCEVTGFLSKVECFRGRLEQAAEHRATARILAAELGSDWVAKGLLEVGVHLALAAGDAEAHRANLEMLVGEGRGVDSGLAAEYALELAHYLALDGDHSGAERVMGRVDERAWPGAPALAAWRRWNLALDDPEAWDGIESAAAALDRPVECYLRARLRWLLGAYHSSAGRRGAAIRLLELAASDYAVTGAAGFVRAVERDVPEPVRPGETSVSLGRLDRLTAAERRVAGAVCAGLSNKEIAATLFLSVKTVEFHVSAIFRKAGVHSRAEFICWAQG